MRVRCLTSPDEPPPPMLLNPDVNERTIIGSVRPMLMMPAAATQPAPILRMYAS